MKFDVIVILSHKSYQGINSEEYNSRLNFGIEQFKKHNSKFIMLCSETANDNNYKYLIGNGIDSKSIILEKRSRDTITEAYFSKLSIPEDCKNILVVSSDYHIYYRVALIFDYVFGVNYNIDYIGVDTDRMRDITTIIDQTNSLKNFFNNFDITNSIENQIDKHELYGGTE